MEAIVEKAPITITLGNLMKIFTRNDMGEGNSKNTVDDRVLLGDACNYLYENISEGSASISKIRNCVTQKNSSPYRQSYNGYKRVANHYFTDLFSKNDQSDTKEKQPEIVVLRSHILKAWKTNLHATPLSDFKKHIEEFLDDDSLKTSEIRDVENIREFITRYKDATRNEDRAEVLTVLTILSITRCQWTKLKNAPVLPKEYKNMEQLRDTSDIEIRYQEGKRYFSEKLYQEALLKLENLEQSKLDAFNGSQREFNQFNSKVLILRSKVRRMLIKKAKLSKTEIEEMKEEIRYELDEAIDNHCIEAMLIKAREYYEIQPDSVFTPDQSECTKLCQEIIDNYPEAEECGEAFWILYNLEEDDFLKDKYLKKAHEYSYDKAVKIYKEKNAVSLTSSLNKSADSTSGVYYINDENMYSDIIKHSAPLKWKLAEYPIKSLSSCCDNSDIWKIISKDNKKQRFFLISNDFERNLQELLHILQAIKSNHEMTDGTIDTKTKISYEFYIRGYEEKIGPFLDTALARIEDMIIPVHIIDDDKQSARVFAQHPLFYPIRELEENEAAHLKLVIIGNTKLCEWLVREASWMLTFRNSKLETEILIIAPDAPMVKDRIKYTCPDIDEMKLQINVEAVEYETSEFLAKIDTAMNSRYTYFAVDMGSDFDNMAVATKIRECSIRKIIQKYDDDDVNELPVIAFHCSNADIANLSLRTIVINENCGSKWFNNYAVIPFGRVDQQYHWDFLTNHILEQLSLNIHLQYYLKDGSAAIKNVHQNKENYFHALKDYYGRTYNRDSSMAVAMSLPYRLYQGIVDKRRLFPLAPIHIHNCDTFYSTESRRMLADWVRKIDWEYGSYTKDLVQKKENSYGEVTKYTITTLDSKSEIYQMAEWEQERWNRFMISRGWTTAKTEHMQLYYNKGNHNQQLYIGKMHPCIEAYSKLETTNKKYKDLSETDKGFQMNNITSIQRTEKILSLYWVEKVKSLFEKRADLQERR